MSHLDGELAIIAWQVRHLKHQLTPVTERRSTPLLRRLARWPRIELHPTDHVWPRLRGYPYAKEFS